MKKTINVIGKACPIPVVETKKILGALVGGDTVEVSVDNFIAVQNLEKMAEQKKLPVTFEKMSDNHYVVTLTQVIKSEETTGAQQLSHQPVGKEEVVVVLASDKMGDGDEKLGHLLMKGFIYALTEQDTLPQTVLLYNRGAYLSTESSESVADLKFLESQGVEVLTCGTCLNHYGLGEKLSVGTVTNMYVILEKQMQATKIVKP